MSKEAIKHIQESILACKSPLVNKNIQIIAVSKLQDIVHIEEIIKTTNIIHFGENYVQEAQAKWEYLKKQYAHIKLHMIGHLQSNKIKQAMQIFDIIQSISSEKMANKLALHKDNEFKQFFIQVNLDSKNKLAGISAKCLPQLLHKCRELNLNIVGLMGITPLTNNPSPYFAFAYHLQKLYNLPHLSIGMSDSYLEAINFGATYIRIGTAIFGIRK